MKKTFSIISLLTLILMFLVACGNNTDPKSYRDRISKEIEENQKEYQQNVENRENAFINNQVKAPDGIRIYAPESYHRGEATLKSFYVTDSSYNSEQDVIFLTYNFTNTAEADTGFYGLKAFHRVYQDGVELIPILEAHNKDENTAVRSGTTIEVVECYILRNTDSDIEICVLGENHTDIAQEYKFPIK